MRIPWCHFRATPTHFWSCDVINVIFRKTAITPSFVSQRLQIKTKISQKVVSGQPNTKISTSVQKLAKNPLNTVTMVTKILTCYISVTVPDRPKVTIIHR